MKRLIKANALEKLKKLLEQYNKLPKSYGSNFNINSIKGFVSAALETIRLYIKNHQANELIPIFDSIQNTQTQLSAIFKPGIVITDEMTSNNIQTLCVILYDDLQKAINIIESRKNIDHDNSATLINNQNTINIEPIIKDQQAATVVPPVPVPIQQPMQINIKQDTSPKTQPIVQVRTPQQPQFQQHQSNPQPRTQDKKRKQKPKSKLQILYETLKIKLSEYYNVHFDFSNPEDLKNIKSKMKEIYNIILQMQEIQRVEYSDIWVLRTLIQSILNMPVDKVKLSDGEISILPAKQMQFSVLVQNIMSEAKVISKKRINPLS